MDRGHGPLTQSRMCCVDGPILDRLHTKFGRGGPLRRSRPRKVSYPLGTMHSCRSSRWSRSSRPPATSRRPSRTWPRASTVATGSRRCSASPGRARAPPMAWTIEQVAEADARHRPQQVARRAAGQRVPGVLPQQPGGVLRQLLRLLPARGVHPVERHVHREGQLDQRRDRPPAPLGDVGAAHPATTSIVVASVSCIYGLGSPEEYRDHYLVLQTG